MSEKKKTSQLRFKEFLKKSALFSLKKFEEPGPDGKKPEESKNNKPLSYYLRRYVSEFKDQRSRLALVLTLSVTASLLGSAFPWTTKIMIDYVLPQRSFPVLAAGCAALLLCMLMQRLVNFTRDYSNNILFGRFLLTMRQRVMAHLNTLPLAGLQKLKIGGVVSRLQDDTDGAANLIFHGLLSPFNAITMVIIATVSLLLVNWKVMIVCLLFCLGMIILTWFIFNKLRPYHRALAQDRTQINARVAEIFGGVQLIRSFRREGTVKKEYGSETNLYWRKLFFGNMVGASTHVCVGGIFALSEICIWLTGGYFYINGSMTIGGVVIFISFTEWFFFPIFNMMSSFAEMQKGMACAERTFDLLDLKPDIVDKPGAVRKDLIEEGLKFESVSFKYPDGTQALDNVDLFIPKGKVTALVGPSGGGKTTLTNLVLRFYDVTSGKITLDGADIKDIQISSYRKLISLVLQDVYLFDGTVKENILFGKRDATEDEMTRAAQTAHCVEFIEKLKDKYDTIIGERGVKLSGGQKQRLALARAVIASPQLLILDEATSNLDTESEGLIQDALRHIFKGRSTLVIAHRLSTIIDADNIVVIDKGKIIEQGTHAQLLERKGKYFDMHSKQTAKARAIENIWNNESDDSEAKEDKK